jgi:hypothetical protein
MRCSLKSGQRIAFQNDTAVHSMRRHYIAVAHLNHTAIDQSSLGTMDKGQSSLMTHLVLHLTTSSTPTLGTASTTSPAASPH